METALFLFLSLSIWDKGVFIFLTMLFQAAFRYEHVCFH